VKTYFKGDDTGPPRGNKAEHLHGERTTGLEPALKEGKLQEYSYYVHGALSAAAQRYAERNLTVGYLSSLPFFNA
jgi:hypothetical protein